MIYIYDSIESAKKQEGYEIKNMKPSVCAFSQFMFSVFVQHLQTYPMLRFYSCIFCAVVVQSK